MVLYVKYQRFYSLKFYKKNVRKKSEFYGQVLSPTTDFRYKKKKKMPCQFPQGIIPSVKHCNSNCGMDKNKIIEIVAELIKK
jgi:hypothetical protein